MIITVNNFVEEARKLKKFQFKSEVSGDSAVWHVRAPEILHNELPCAFLITKVAPIRMAIKRNMPYEVDKSSNNGPWLDSLYHRQLELMGTLDKATLISEIDARRDMPGYKSNYTYDLAIKCLFETMSLAQQKKYVMEKRLELFYCPIAKQWGNTDYMTTVRLDGVSTKILASSIELIREKYDHEPYFGSWFWTKGTMSFYPVEEIGQVSLYNIIAQGIIVECPDCGALILEDSICQVCNPGVTVESIYQQYSARAERVFQFKSKKEDGIKPLFLGVELELENRTSQNLLATWKLLKTHAIIKRDGSVSSGIEICSAPATYNVQKEEFKAFFDNVAAMKLLAKENCGMHVHVDRANLTELQIGKMLSFMYNKENRDFINKISGRKDNSYCSLEHNQKLTSGVSYVDQSDVQYGRRLRRTQSSGRYTGLNLAPEKTIEFRIFASTVSYTVFLKNLEFVKSMIDFTKPSAVQVKSIKDFAEKEVYLAFLQNNKRDYPNLVQFLAPTPKASSRSKAK